jgi:hypothetical protein
MALGRFALRGQGMVVYIMRLIDVRGPLDAGTKDLARQALAAGMPTYLIENEQVVPRRLKKGDSRLI